MPHIRIRSMADLDVKKLSEVLPKELSQLMETPEDNFTVEKIASTFYRTGEIVPDGKGGPMVEIHWFDRGQDVKIITAKKVTELVRPYTSSEYIAVVFFDLPKTNYFENGSHF